MAPKCPIQQNNQKPGFLLGEETRFFCRDIRIFNNLC